MGQHLLYCHIIKELIYCRHIYQSDWRIGLETGTFISRTGTLGLKLAHLSVGLAHSGLKA